jgi:nitroreductase
MPPLVVFASAALDGKPLPWAAYDTGQAAAHFTVQAHASGLHTHQMGGFDRDAIAQAFGFGDDLAAVTVMAVGALGDIDAAPERCASASCPRVRRPIADSLVVND